MNLVEFFDQEEIVDGLYIIWVVLNEPLKPGGKTIQRIYYTVTTYFNTSPFLKPFVGLEDFMEIEEEDLFHKFKHEEIQIHLLAKD